MVITAQKNEEKLELLPEVQEQETLPVLDAQLKEGKTSPPKHFTEDTLLSAMETAGKERMRKKPNARALEPLPPGRVSSRSWSRKVF